MRDPGDRRRRLRRLGLGRRACRGRPRRRRPRRPLDRPPRRPSRRRPARGRHVRGPARPCRACSSAAGSTRSSTAPPARSSASPAPTRPATTRDNVAGGVALLEAVRASRREPPRLQLERRGLRRPGRDADPGGRPAAADQHVRRDEADLRRRRWPRTVGPTASGRSASATSTSPGRPSALGEDHDPETHLIPNVLAAAAGTGSR